jgi:hypothetical protein
VEIHPVGGELFLVGGRVERQTDRRNNMTKLIVALRNFAKASKNEEANNVRVTIFIVIFVIIITGAVKIVPFRTGSKKM